MTEISLGMPAAPPPVLAPRRRTRQIKVGKVGVGSESPVSVQSMTTTLTSDVNATLQQIAELTAAGKLVTVAGGGDTVAALNRAGATGRFTYVSTAGGAFLEWLEGKALPGVEVLRAK